MHEQTLRTLSEAELLRRAEELGVTKASEMNREELEEEVARAEHAEEDSDRPPQYAEHGDPDLPEPD
jgi:hypothetical protein